MMGWVFANLKVKDVQDNRVASQLEADSTASYGFSAIIATSNLRGSRLATSGLRSRRAWLALHSGEVPACSRTAVHHWQFGHPAHTNKSRFDRRACNTTSDKDHQITLPSAAKLAITLTDFGCKPRDRNAH